MGWCCWLLVASFSALPLRSTSTDKENNNEERERDRKGRKRKQKGGKKQRDIHSLSSHFTRWGKLSKDCIVWVVVCRCIVCVCGLSRGPQPTHSRPHRRNEPNETSEQRKHLQSHSHTFFLPSYSVSLIGVSSSTFCCCWSFHLLLLSSPPPPLPLTR